MAKNYFYINIKLKRMQNPPLTPFPPPHSMGVGKISPQSYHAIYTTVILSDPSFQKGHYRFTMVPFTEKSLLKMIDSKKEYLIHS